MSRNKFSEILRFLRFDEKDTRSHRIETDRFAAATPVWSPFIANCLLCYKPSENITVDEQLFPCKARCPFIQYISSKPDKFGIKFWLAVDTNSKYLLSGFPYLGKDEQRPVGVPLGEHVVMRLAEPHISIGRNITCDNFFTAKCLGDKLKRKKTSMVGTLKKSRREVPQSARSTTAPLHTTTVYKSGDMTLTSYQGKKNKNVLLLSTMHQTVTINEQHPKKLPETVEFYNSTKFGVDVIDQMARLYTVKYGCRRWPMHVFFNVLDLAAINAWVLYKEVTGEKVSRRQFIFKLAEELTARYVPIRRPAPLPAKTTQESNVRKTCQIGGCRGKNRSKHVCGNCSKFVCGSCLGITQYTCAKCYDAAGGFG